jgi:inner membrane protein involved in colicin E2 resistance
MPLGIYLAGALRSSRAGALALFALLSTVMTLTRKRDWYADEGIVGPQ